MKKNQILLVTVVLTCTISAQTVSEYQKQQQAELQKMQQEQTMGTNKLQKEYADYVSKRDAEWADYLRQEWEQFDVFAGRKAPQKPKPITIPTYVPPAKLPVPQAIPAVISPKKEPVVPKTNPQIVEPIRKPAAEETNTNKVTFGFYGRTLTIPYDIAIRQGIVSNISQDALCGFWEKESACNYTPVVERLLKTKSELQLNDYGYFQLVQQFAKSIFSTNENTARLMTWFLMVRSGYGVRVGYKENQIVLLVPIQQEVYGQSFLTIGATKFYIFPEIQNGSFYTYDKDYSASTKLFDLKLISPLNFTSRSTEKALTFAFDNRSYNLKVAYDPDLIDFYKTYPQAEFNVYFNAVTSTQAKLSLVAALKPYTTQMDELKAVNFLLHFVQTAFEYKTDQNQFNREKYFFTEELFYYPFSDCEDRSVLFAYLVRELLGLKVIGLNYPDHMATAVAFSKMVNGDYIIVKNTRFVVCDPTYINAPVGQTIPHYRGISPIVIDMND